MGLAMLTGQQGAPSSPPLSTPSTSIDGVANVACEAKHAVAYGFGGRDWYRADVNGALGMQWAEPLKLTKSHILPDRTLMDIYVRPWKAAITEGGLRGLMVTHPEVSGLPMREGGYACAPLLALCEI